MTGSLLSFLYQFLFMQISRRSKKKKEKKKKKKVVLPSDVGRNKSPRCGLNKNYLPNMIQSLSINKMKKKKEDMLLLFSVLCFTVTQITSSTVSLTAPWSWLQAACRCLLQCCLPSAESV